MKLAQWQRRWPAGLTSVPRTHTVEQNQPPASGPHQPTIPKRDLVSLKTQTKRHCTQGSVELCKIWTNGTVPKDTHTNQSRCFLLPAAALLPGAFFYRGTGGKPRTLVQASLWKQLSYVKQQLFPGQVVGFYTSNGREKHSKRQEYRLFR